MNVRITAPTILAVAVIVVILLGEAVVFTSSHNDYSSSVSGDSDSLDYTIDARGNHVFDVVVLKGSADKPVDVSIYYDESYASMVNEVSVAVGGRALDQKYYVDQLKGTLQLRDIDNVSVVDAKGLKSLTEKSGKDHAVICLSGSLPSTVYDGTADSPILKWIESGGRLYWAGNVIGKYVSDGLSVTTVDGERLFVDAMFNEVPTQVHERIDNGFCECLYLQNNDTLYTPKTLLGESEYLAIGYTDDSSASIFISSLGQGFVCIMGGDYSNFQRIDLAQVLAAGISPTTEISDVVYGTVSGHAEGTMKGGDHAYVFIGGYFPVYGELHEVD